MLYKGYVLTKGKQSIEKLKDRNDWKTYEEVKDADSFGGILSDDTILIDIDDYDQSEMMMNIVESLQMNCRVYQTSRGRHFLFKNHKVMKNYTHVNLACGLVADIKVGSKTSYEVIKIDGQERFIEWDIDQGQQYDEIPFYFYPVKSNSSFVDMRSGDGRNQALFNYILTLSSNSFSMEQSRETIRIINKFVLRDPLDEEELNTILREEAFQTPTFYSDKSFLFDKFAEYIKSNSHIARINGQLHIYHDGVYVNGYREIERMMISMIPNLKKSWRREIIDYLELIAETVEPADARYIAFNNGIYDVVEDELVDFTPNIIMTNKIPWNFDRAAYNELTDKTLDKLTCQDKAVRKLLEECIGYCFYRRNELGKAFILTGEKSNGKSTFLDLLKTILGDENISALDLKELGDRFSTSMMFGKLANIGDDISDDFMIGNQVAIFKKIVTGNRIKAENKGQDPFEFNPYVKLLFAANEIPRMRDKTGATLRRLVIIPFNARFTKDDPDFDPFIKYKLIDRSSIEYLIKVGIEGLRRVLESNSFTRSLAVENQIMQYEEENNPILMFIDDQGIDAIKNESTSDVYRRYQVFCAENALSPMSKVSFVKTINKKLDLETSVGRIGDKVIRIFKKR